MTDEPAGLTETQKFRCTAAEKTAYKIAAQAAELTPSEWLRQAAEEKMARDLNMTVGDPGRPPLRVRVQDPDDNVIETDAPVFAFPS